MLGRCDDLTSVSESSVGAGLGARSISLIWEARLWKAVAFGRGGVWSSSPLGPLICMGRVMNRPKLRVQHLQMSSCSLVGDGG